MKQLHIIVKILLLPVLLVIMNFIYEKYFYEDDLQNHSPIIEKIRKVAKDSCQIVYLGESSNTTYRRDDVDQRSISEMIQDYYSIKVGNINKEATHAGMYFEYLRNIPENTTLKTVVVTMNLRSFDASWIYSDLETALQKSIVLLKDYPPLCKRFMLAFKAYDVKTVKERTRQFKHAWKYDTFLPDYSFAYKNVKDWDQAIYLNKIKNKDGVPDESMTVLACHYIKAYAFSIDVNKNPRIADFDNIVNLCRERGWNLVFNLMAENVKKASELVGEDLMILMRSNRDLLVSRYSGENVIVIDNMEKVPDEEFIDQNWTTEHYAEKGRRIVAKNVALGLRKWHSSSFISDKE